jgi:hypothetical protein
VVGRWSGLLDVVMPSLSCVHVRKGQAPASLPGGGCIGELGAWVVANALAVAGPVRETYLVGPRDADDPAVWRTEIGRPVFRVADVPSGPVRS